MKMKHVKAPYNFVPLNKQVVYPHWGNHVSHDLPFKDGLSGELELTINAKSPIFIRDILKNKEKSNSFFNVNGHYMIPGSSIKGMLRAVLEVLTFSQMGNKVNTHRYAVRDLSDAHNFYMKEMSKKTYGGFLYQEDGKYYIEDCGEPGRISHEELDRVYKKGLAQFFGPNGGFKMSNAIHKSAVHKYEWFRGQSLKNIFSFDHIDKGRSIYIIDKNNGKEGILVFTGQPGPRQKNRKDDWTGKHLEFIFFNDEKNELHEVQDEVIENFKFAYYEHDKNNWSKDWESIREKLKAEKKVPIFFQKDEEGNVKHLGLSYLYKLPYNYSVNESIDIYQNPQDNPDFSETLFGSTESTAFKSRVHIGHAWADMDTVDEMPLVKDILSGPKASYYPNYIRQSGGNYRTFMDEGSVVSGWKRYPIHKSGVTTREEVLNNENEKVKTSFKPLQIGSTFHFKLRYHNLRPMELGALVSAITFHNGEDHFHSIGTGKPLGYGKIKLSLKDQDKYENHLRDFEAYMNAALNFNSAKWHEQDQIVDLLAMTREQNNQGESALEYMKLGRGKGNNDFVEAKNRREGEGRQATKIREYLKRYSDLENIESESGNTLCSDEDIQKMGVLINKERNRFDADKSLAEQIDKYKIDSKNDAKQFLKNVKEELKAKLRELQNAEKEKLQKAFKKKKGAITQEGGLKQIESIVDKENARNRFKTLKKEIKKYCKQLGQNNEMLPETDHADLITILKRIIPELPKNDQKRWTNDFDRNADLKKVAEWIGEDNAKEWHRDFFKKA